MIEITENEFKDWSDKMEEEYQRRKEEEGKSRINLGDWFGNLCIKGTLENKKVGTKIRDDYKVFLENNHKRNSISALIYFLEEIVAKNFYNNINDVFHDDPFTGNGGSYYRALLRYWTGETRFYFELPTSSDRRCYCIEIFSALQREYQIFDSFDSLNKLLMQVGSLDNHIGSRGLYLRDYRELCVAFAIMQGYSVAETINLIDEAKDVLEEAQKVQEAEPANKSITMIIGDDEHFGKFLRATSDKTKEDFLKEIRQQSKLFPAPAKLLHWSTFEDILYFSEVLFAHGNYSTDKFKKEWMKKDNFFKRIEGIRDNLWDFIAAKGIYDDNESIENSSQTLRKAILDRLNIHDFYKDEETEYCPGEGWTGPQLEYEDAPKDYSIVVKAYEKVRALYIVACMKNLEEQKARSKYKGNSAEKVLDWINENLSGWGLREIEYTEGFDSQPSANLADVFDWFIIEAIGFEALHVNDSYDVITGYPTIIKFITNEPEFEL